MAIIRRSSCAIAVRSTVSRTGQGTSHREELRRYHAVIHLRTPAQELGCNHQNPLRTESAAAAAADAHILQAWASHPRRFVIEPSLEFMDKAAETLRVLRDEMPDCCKQHVVPAVRDHVTRIGGTTGEAAL